MVNEIGESTGNKEGEESQGSQWTIRLGKHVSYNPSPFRDQSDVVQKTIISIIILGVGIFLVTRQNYAMQVLGWLVIGSMIFLYCLSLYEILLLSKKEKEKLR